MDKKDEHSNRFKKKLKSGKPFLQKKLRKINLMFVKIWLDKRRNQYSIHLKMK